MLEKKENKKRKKSATAASENGLVLEQMMHSHTYETI